MRKRNAVGVLADAGGLHDTFASQVDIAPLVARSHTKRMTIRGEDPQTLPNGFHFPLPRRVRSNSLAILLCRGPIFLGRISATRHPSASKTIGPASSQQDFKRILRASATAVFVCQRSIALQMASHDQAKSRRGWGCSPPDADSTDRLIWPGHITMAG